MQQPSKKVSSQNTSKNSNSSLLRKKIGVFGEQLAHDFLMRKGYIILVRNFYAPGGEIDIIAQRKSDLIIVEVKTRTSQVYGFGEEAVDKAKWKRMKKALLAYHAPFPVQYVQFDIIVVDINTKQLTATIKHLKNIIFD